MMELVREPVAEYLDFHVARTIVDSAFQKRTAEVKTLGEAGDVVGFSAPKFRTFPFRNLYPQRSIAAYFSRMSFSKSA
jgi:hypothetical protein